MLGMCDIRGYLARMSYKPGWRWELHEDPWEGPFVRFVVEVQDAYGGGSTTLGIESWLPPMPSFEYLDLWMAWRIGRIESHESREFLQRDGQLVFDPHEG